MTASLLAFDTSTEHMAVALQTRSGLQVWDGAGGAQASAQLIPMVQRLLHQAGLDLSQLQAIAFGRGPGAFTGLRTACAVAQGLAFGAALPVLGLDSLMIVAEAARGDLPPLVDGGLDLHVAMDARMGEVYAGHYLWNRGRWAVQVSPALYTLEALNAAWRRCPPQAVAGSALAAFGERLAPGPAQRLTSSEQRAAALMRLAQQAWTNGEGMDAALALPLYLRDKVALTTAEREALRTTEGAA